MVGVYVSLFVFVLQCNINARSENLFNVESLCIRSGNVVL